MEGDTVIPIYIGLVLEGLLEYAKCSLERAADGGENVVVWTSDRARELSVHRVGGRLSIRFVDLELLGELINTCNLSAWRRNDNLL